MKFKKKLRKFFTLTRKGTGGFTLVELIVVIAILAILAGVGTVGYSGYVKSANKKADMVLVGNFVRALDVANNSGAINFEIANQFADGLQIPVGYVLLSQSAFDDGKFVKVLTPGTVTDNGNGTYTAGEMSDTNVVLDSAISAAFGANYATDVKLTYDGWVQTESAAFFASAGEMVDSVKTMGDNVFWLTDKFGGLTESGDIKVGSYTIDLFSQNYNDSAHLMSVFAGHVASLDKDAFVRAWENVSTEAEAFGLNAAGREHYSAARAAYTNCVATNVANQGNAPAGIEGTHDAATHAAQMKEYGDSAGQVVAEKASNNSFVQGIVKGLVDSAMGSRKVNFPKAVCASTFVSGKSDFRGCAVCKALTAQYQSSNTDTTDAEAFYDTMVTGASEGKYNPETGNKDEFFSWMTANANSFADMYGDVAAYSNGKSVIAMAVFYKDGKLQTNVNPLEADPRKQD